MKLQDALKLATPGPWQVSISRWPNGKLTGPAYIYAPNGPDGWRHVSEPFMDEAAPAAIQSMQEVNAHLSAHSVNVLPKLVEALSDCHEHLCDMGCDCESEGDKDLEPNDHKPECLFGIVERALAEAGEVKGI